MPLQTGGHTFCYDPRLTPLTPPLGVMNGQKTIIAPGTRGGGVSLKYSLNYLHFMRNLWLFFNVFMLPYNSPVFRDVWKLPPTYTGVWYKTGWLNGGFIYRKFLFSQSQRETSLLLK